MNYYCILSIHQERERCIHIENLIGNSFAPRAVGKKQDFEEK